MWRDIFEKYILDPLWAPKQFLTDEQHVVLQYNEFRVPYVDFGLMAQDSDVKERFGTQNVKALHHTDKQIQLSRVTSVREEHPSSAIMSCQTSEIRSRWDV